MDVVAEGTHEVCLATAGLAEQYKDTSAAQVPALPYAIHELSKSFPCFLVDGFHIEGVISPDFSGSCYGTEDFWSTRVTICLQPVIRTSRRWNKY
jgi:hypothetical protein